MSLVAVMVFSVRVGFRPDFSVFLEKHPKNLEAMVDCFSVTRSNEYLRETRTFPDWLQVVCNFIFK